MSEKNNNNNNVVYLKKKNQISIDLMGTKNRS